MFHVSESDGSLSTILSQWGWTRAPVHRPSEKGAYMFTVGTYEKRRLLNSPDRLDLALGLLFSCATSLSGRCRREPCYLTTITLWRFPLGIRKT